jgi:hypothetical protein
MMLLRIPNLTTTIFAILSLLSSSLADNRLLTRKDDSSKNTTKSELPQYMKIIGSSSRSAAFHYIPPRAPPPHVQHACSSLHRLFNTSLVDRLAHDDPLYGMDGTEWLTSDDLWWNPWYGEDEVYTFVNRTIFCKDDEFEKCRDATIYAGLETQLLLWLSGACNGSEGYEVPDDYPDVIYKGTFNASSGDHLSALESESEPPGFEGPICAQSCPLITSKWNAAKRESADMLCVMHPSLTYCQSVNWTVFNEETFCEDLEYSSCEEQCETKSERTEYLGFLNASCGTVKGWEGLPVGWEEVVGARRGEGSGRREMGLGMVLVAWLGVLLGLYGML